MLAVLSTVGRRARIRPKLGWTLTCLVVPFLVSPAAFALDRLIPPPPAQHVTTSPVGPRLGSCSDNEPPVADAGPNRTVEAGTSIHFDGTGSYDPDGRTQALSYVWFFDDGESSREAVVEHVYVDPDRYTLTLMVTDACGHRGIDTAVITVTQGDNSDPCLGNDSPWADVGAVQDAEAGATISFDGSDSSDNDGVIETFEWDFGDGTSAVGRIVTHAYDEPGDYRVTLTVTDDCGATNEDWTTVSVSEPDPCAGNLTPTASAGAAQNVETGVTVSFDGSGSSDLDGWIDTYQWDFGDGWTASGREVLHTFTQPGTFTVELTVTDNCGATAQHSITATVEDPDPEPCEDNAAPTADAGLDRETVVNVSIDFDGEFSSDDGEIISYEWTFGDGSSATGQRPSHAYSSDGTFTVTLTVTDGCDVSASDTAVVDVFATDTGTPELNADFSVDPQTPRAFDEITFFAEDAAPHANDVFFRWDMGDGSWPGYGGPTVTRAYDLPGQYTVTLSLIDKVTWQILDESSKIVTVDAGLTLVGLLGGTLQYNNAIAVVNDTVWVAGSPGKVVTADLSDPSSPRLMLARTVAGTPSDVAATSSIVAVAAGQGGVYLYDPNTPLATTPLVRIDTYVDGSFSAFGVALAGTKLFVTGGWDGLRVFDVTNRQAPVKLTTKAGFGYTRRITVLDDRAYVIDDSLPGVRVLNLASASNPFQIGQVIAGAIPAHMDVHTLAGTGTILALAEDVGGLELFDVSTPSAPVFLSRPLSGNEVGGVALYGNSAFVGYGSLMVELDLSSVTSPQQLAVVALQMGLPTGQVRMVDGRVIAGYKAGVVAVLEP